MSSFILHNLENSGFDIKNTLSRLCGNKALYFKLLNMFLKDSTFQKMCDDYDNGDMVSFSADVHTLKGTAGNLGMTDLAADCSELLSLLRSNTTSDVETVYKKLRNDYNFVIAVLSDKNEEGY